MDDVASRHGGSQKILAGGQAIPLQIKQALLYASIREPTKCELVNLPRIMLTGGEVWDPGSIGDIPEVLKQPGGVHSLAPSTIISKIGGVVNTTFLTYLHLPDLGKESEKRMHVTKNRCLLGQHPSFLPREGERVNFAT